MDEKTYEPAPHPAEVDIGRKTFAVMQEARSRCTLTEQQIADAAGVSRPTVTKYFNGDQKDPNFKTVIRIWRGMGYRDEELINAIFPRQAVNDISETADRIGAEAGLAVECEYLKKDNARLLGIVQDRQFENAYHKAEIIRLTDERDNELQKTEDHYRQLLDEKERSNRRLFLASWILFGVLVAVLIGVTALIIHDLGNPDSGWFRVAGAAVGCYSGTAWNL